MKKKLLAIVLSVVMIAALLVPMMAVSAEEPTINVYFGTIEKKTENGKDYLAIPVEFSGNTEELFALQYYVMSKEKLAVGKFEGSTVTYKTTNEYGDDLNIGFSQTVSRNVEVITDKGYTGFNIILDSTEGADGLPVESGNLCTVWFELPETAGTYTFTLEDRGFVYLVKKNGTVDKARYKVNVGADVQYTVEGETCVSHIEISDKENSKAPTCTEPGAIVTKCDVCGKQLSNVPMDPLGHNIVADEENSSDATCTEDGVEAKKCTRCDYTETKTIPALGHDWDNGTVDEDVTCGETADILYTCERCGETKTETGAKVEHDMVADEANSKDPTCTEDGVEAKKCTRCDHTETKSIPALGHDFDVEYEVTKVPTADEEGKMEAECANGCGETDVIALKKLATEIKDGDDYIKAEEPILPEDTGLILVDVDEKDGKYTLEFVIGSEIIPDLKGEVEVGLDLAEFGEEYENPEVYKVNADGTTTLISEVKDGKLVFKADLEGNYVMTYNEKADEEKKPAPDTDDAMNTVLFSVVALIAVAGLVVVGKKRFAL